MVRFPVPTLQPANEGNPAKPAYVVDGDGTLREIDDAERRRLEASGVIFNDYASADAFIRSNEAVRARRSVSLPQRENATLETTAGAATAAGSLAARSASAQGTAERLAAFRALLAAAELRVDTAGRFVFSQGELHSRHFESAIRAIFGPNLSVTGDFTIDDDRGALVQELLSLTEIDVTGHVSIKAESWSAEAEAKLKSVLGPNVIVAGGKIVLDDTGFRLAQLNAQWVRSFGPQASVLTSLKSRVTSRGVEELEILAAYKAVIGGTTVDTQGRLQIEDHRLTEVELKAALRTVLGDDITLDGNGRFSWDAQSGIRAEVRQRFEAIFGALRVDADGQIRVQGGQLDSELRATVATELGPWAVVTEGRLVFDDGLFDALDLDSRWTAQFGGGADLSANLTATFTRQGIAKLDVVAAYRALVAGTTVDARGSLRVVDNRLTRAQLDAALKTVFGDGITYEADGSFRWDAQAGVSAEVRQQFAAIYGAMEVEADGQVTFAGGSLDASVEAALRGQFGPFAGVLDGRLVITDGQFDSAELNGRFSRFGDGGSLEASFETRISAQGIERARIFAAVKRIIAGVHIGVDGRFTIEGDRAEVLAAFKLVYGEDLQVDANGRVNFEGLTVRDAEFHSQFRHVIRQTRIDAIGQIHFDGRLSGDLTTRIERVFGDQAAIHAATSGDVVISFDHEGVRLDRLVAAVDADLGDIDLAASFKYDDRIYAAIALSAMEELQALRADGAITLRADGSFEIAGGRIEAAELSALVSAVAGEQVNLTTGGKLVYQNGELATELTQEVRTTFSATTLDASGRLVFTNGQVALAGRLKGTTELGPLSGQIDINFNGLRTLDVDFALRSVGKLSGVGIDGKVHISEGKLQAVNLTSNLVTQIRPGQSISAAGSLVVGDASVAAQGQVSFPTPAGPIQLGVSHLRAAEVYRPGPEEEVRLATQRQGGHWGLRVAQTRGDLKFGVEGSLGALPVTFGFSSDAAASHTVRVISVHPTAEDAGRRDGLFDIRQPRAVEDVARMRPGELYSTSGEGRMGATGKIGVGYSAGVAELSAGFEVSHQAHANMTLEVERLPDNEVAIRVRRGNGEVSGSSVGLKVGLSGEVVDTVGLTRLLPMAEQLKPVVAEVAQVSFEKSWQQLEENDVAFDFRFDLDNPMAAAALEAALDLKLDEAQALAATVGSGVHLQSRVATSMNAEVEDMNLNVLGLNMRYAETWLEKVREELAAGRYQRVESHAHEIIHDPFLPWRVSRRQQTSITHTIDTPQTQFLPRSARAMAGVSLEMASVMTESASSARPTEGSARELFEWATGRGNRARGATALESLEAMPMGRAAMASRAESEVALLVERTKPPLGMIPILSDTRGYLKLNLDLTDGLTSPRDLERHYLGPVSRLMRAMGLPQPVVDEAADLRALLAHDPDSDHGLIPDKDAVAFGLGDKRFGNSSATFDAYVAPAGTARLFRNRSGHWHGRSSYVTAYLRTEAQMRGVAIEEVRGDRRVLERTDAFAAAMMRLQDHFRKNIVPPKEPGEAEHAYRERVQSLIDSPEAYYNFVEEVFHEIQDNEHGKLTASLAALRMVGADNVAMRASLDLPDDVMDGIRERGRRNVQRFGAAVALAGRNVEVDLEAGTVALDVGDADPAALSRAATALFTRSLTGTVVDGRLILESLAPVGRRQLAVAELLPALSVHDDVVRYAGDPGLLEAALGEGIASYDETFGLRFNNAGYGKVSFAEALESLFDNAEDIPIIPTVLPLSPASERPVDADGPDFQVIHTGSGVRPEDLVFLESLDLSL